MLSIKPIITPTLSFFSFPLTKTLTLTLTLNVRPPAAISTAPTSQIDLTLNPSTNTYTSSPPLVAVLWDLDNKPPYGPPFPAARALLNFSSLFGHVDGISAYANRHAFSHLPEWVLQQRQQQRSLEILERKGLSLPETPYLCSVCGRKCKTSLDLKKHFKNLHQREREKKLGRMRSLKGKKRQKFKERYITGNVKYVEAARELLTPKKGYGLAAELRRAGVYVKTVEDKPQAADAALKRQMMHSMNRGVDWLVLVSDDSDFSEMVRKAREAELRTVVVGDGMTALGRSADLWVPWRRVENGDVKEDEILKGSRRWVDNGGLEDGEDGDFLEASFYESRDCGIEEVFDRKVSGFSEEDGHFAVEFSDGEFDSDNENEEDDEDYYI